jgi:hypothetical protein
MFVTLAPPTATPKGVLELPFKAETGEGDVAGAEPSAGEPGGLAAHRHCGVCGRGRHSALPETTVVELGGFDDKGRGVMPDSVVRLRD